MPIAAKIHNIAGIGFGPANIALAAYYADNNASEDIVFLEQMATPNWQPEMLFENAMDIHSNVQNIPHRDLATPRDPKSRFTFLNYLHENGLLLSHLNMDILMPMRPDFAAYIRWAAHELSGNVEFGRTITGLSVAENGSSRVYRIECENREPVFARNVVIGTGRSPYIPPQFRDCIGSSRVFHLSRYNSSIQRLVRQGAQKIAVIGSSQSAVEIVLHLTKFEPRIETHSIFRRFAYPLKDTSPFMSEIFFPEFTDMYYSADQDLKRKIDRDVTRTNYGACDMDVLEELYRQRYYEKLHGKELIRVNRLTDVLTVSETADGVTLKLYDHEADATREETFDDVVLVTGFRNIGADDRSEKVPWILSGLTESLELDADGCVQVDRDYKVRLREEADLAGGVMLNGLCEATHGMGDAGSLSLLSKRAETIALGLRQDAARPTVAAE